MLSTVPPTSPMRPDTQQLSCPIVLSGGAAPYLAIISPADQSERGNSHSLPLRGNTDHGSRIAIRYAFTFSSHYSSSSQKSPLSSHTHPLSPCRLKSSESSQTPSSIFRTDFGVISKDAKAFGGSARAQSSALLLGIQVTILLFEVANPLLTLFFKVEKSQHKSIRGLPKQQA